ncbi:MAG TPA: DUF1549 domain-containing protein, partial [Candidatus Eisenbacteria bacterium]|nr:DUF1549 domain-containing protein [Candidatus Eisenbacteria bacterium]
MILVLIREGVAGAVDGLKLPPPAARAVDFVKDIQPILANHCYSCHGPEKQKNDLRLDVKSIALQGGVSGPVIMPGRSAESKLIQFVSGYPQEMLMPQKGERLSPEQIGLLRAWIDQGAKWPEGLDPKNYVNKRDHWAFKTPVSPPVPEVKNKRLVRNPIDNFILARLTGENLSASPEADRVTLIRRLSFDLIGLPPTPEEVRQFVEDRDPRAYENLVDRLLVSPRYGERWARHWLDVVRFAESAGFETNLERKNAWPYRDYVIRAFNDDKPYPQFVLEQLAGDAVGVEAATGFIVGGPWDAVKSPDVNLTAQQRMDELHDMVSTTGSAFLGLTVGCARCHNHKFDPISQVDYYALQAVFAGVQHGDRTLRPPDAGAREKEADTLRKRIDGIDAQLTQFEPMANPSLAQTAPLKMPNARLNEETFAPAAAKFVRFTIHETLGNAEPCIDELEVYSARPERGSPDPQHTLTIPRAAGQETRAPNVALASHGAKATASGTFPNSDLHKLEHINDGKVGNSRSWISNEAGKGWIQIEFPETVLIDKIVWGRDREEKFKDRLPTNYTIEAGLSLSLLQRVAGRPALRPAVHPRQNIERFTPVEAKFLRFTISATTSLEPCIDELEVYAVGEHPQNVALANHGTKATASGTYPNSEIHRLEHINDGRVGNSRSWISSETGKGWVQLEFPAKVFINKVVWGRDREEKYSDRLATNYQIAVSLGSNDWKVVAGSNDRESYVAGAKPKLAYSPAGLSAAEVERLNQLLAEKKRLQDKIKELTTFPTVYAGKFEQPGPTYRLNRGEPLQKREQVTPGALKGLGPKLDLAADTPEQKRRSELARWICGPKNPLTARVVANR